MSLGISSYANLEFLFAYLSLGLLAFLPTVI